MRSRGQGITGTLRAGDWWEFKLSPIFATIYATAFLLETPIASLWPLLALALAALVPGAAYVSLINDLTDIREDVASGKANRLVGKSRGFVALALACCVSPGIAVAIYWRGDPLLLSLYLAAWVAFTLYSVPPARLKTRGFPGLLADASGAHLFPTLVVVVMVFRWRGQPVDPVWLAAAGAWSLGLGLRGNLWHQISDLDNDRKIGLRTFAQNRTIAQLRGIGNFVIFPAEIAGFAVMLWRAGSLLPVAFLLPYALLALARSARWERDFVIVVPTRKYSVAMLEYYEVFYPLAFLLASAARHPWDALIIAAHLSLFPRRAGRALRDAFMLLRGGIGKLGA